MFSNTKTYELPLSADYVRHWGVMEAVRELLQNALDSDSPFEFQWSGGALLLHSRNAHLSPQTLVLGTTTKAEREDAIGSFGEGYKIALLVLARCGKPVTVLNSDRKWTPMFQRSAQFGCDVLHIRDEALPKHEQQPGLTFRIDNLGAEETLEIVDSCLHMQEEPPDAVEVMCGRILPSKPGKLYVGGLYVCDTQLDYGYDVKPEFLELERDRQTVSSFDLEILTRDMWFQTQRYDEVAGLIERGSRDVRYAEYNSPELVKEACYRLFQERVPGGIVAKTHEEMEELVDKGLTKVVVVNSAFHANVHQAPSYRSTLGSVVRTLTPHEELQKWYDDNKRYLGRVPKVGFKALLQKATKWRNK